MCFIKKMNKNYQYLMLLKPPVRLNKGKLLKLCYNWPVHKSRGLKKDQTPWEGSLGVCFYYSQSFHKIALVSLHDYKQMSHLLFMSHWNDHLQQERDDAIFTLYVCTQFHVGYMPYDMLRRPEICIQCTQRNGCKVEDWTVYMHEM